MASVELDKLAEWLDEQIAECQGVIDSNSYFWGQCHYSEEEIDSMNNPHKERRDLLQEVKNRLLSVNNVALNDCS